jgi:hypothetical protein
MSESSDKPDRQWASGLSSGSDVQRTVLAKILGPPPLLESEDPQLFTAFFSLFVAEYDPKTISDWLDLRNLVLSHWEQFREDRIKVNAIRVLQEEDDEASNRVTYIITEADAEL